MDWGKKPRVQNKTLDEFVQPQKKLKRLNADIPADLHARFKSGAALEGREMTDIIIEFLEEKYPKQ